MSQVGRYIVIEGLEGAGKSSAMQVVSDYLADRAIPYDTCREPGGTPIAESIREIIKGQPEHEHLYDETELLLMYAARKQLWSEVIAPKLSKGIWVVSDRNEWSSIAYQGYGRQLDLGFIKHLSNFLLDTAQPSLVLYLDVNPVIGLERAEKRGAHDRIEQAGIEFFQRVHQGYLDLVAQCHYAKSISAEQPIEQVHQSIRDELSKLIKALP